MTLNDSLFRAGHTPVSLYKQKLDIITNNIYGADKDALAVSTAILRLWLSLAVDFDGDGPPDPPPNLDLKLTVGDSIAGPSTQMVTNSTAAPDSQQMDFTTTWAFAKKPGTSFCIKPKPMIPYAALAAYPRRLGPGTKCWTPCVPATTPDDACPKRERNPLTPVGPSRNTIQIRPQRPSPLRHHVEHPSRRETSPFTTTSERRSTPSVAPIARATPPGYQAELVLQSEENDGGQ